MNWKSIVAAAAVTVVTAGIVAPAVAAAPIPRADDGRRGTTSFEGVQVAYYEYGPSADDAPTVVISGGWPGSSLPFAPRAQDFAARGMHVIRYDQRGTGASGHPQDPAAYSLPKLAGEFGAVIDAAARGHKVNVFGASGFSVFVASEYTTQKPGRISSITSIDAPSADLAFDALNRKTAEADAGSDPAFKAQVAAQRAALSYISVDPETAARAVDAAQPVLSGLNMVWAAAAQDGPGLERYGAAEYPLFTAEDTKSGAYKYQWMVANRSKPVHAYLDVPQLRVYQTDFDPITTSLLTDGLAERTPNLRYFTIPTTRMVVAESNALSDMVVAGAVDAIRETPQ